MHICGGHAVGHWGMRSVIGARGGSLGHEVGHWGTRWVIGARGGPLGHAVIRFESHPGITIQLYMPAMRLINYIHSSKCTK